VSLLLAACGGDDALSTTDFASEADRSCREAEKELEELGESADSADDIADPIDEVNEETRQATMAQWRKYDIACLWLAASV
jgi:hypothetical protein